MYSGGDGRGDDRQSLRPESRLPPDGRRRSARPTGPHFKELAREWTKRFASPATLGGQARQTGFTQVNDPAARERFGLDVVVESTGRRAGDDRPVLLAIGEAKGGVARLGKGALRRLERLRGQLAPRAVVDDARLLLFSRGGFEPELVAEARHRRDLALVDLERLYAGD